MVVALLPKASRKAKGNYSASKGGVEAFTRSLALELVRKHIYVNCLALGYFQTGLGTKLTEKQITITQNKIPLKEFGEPVEICKAVEFMIS